MTNKIINIAIGAIILFLWQFLSWSVLPIHQNEYTYTANQDQIIANLTQNLTEEGTYMLPGMPPGTPHEEAEKKMQNCIGKPWASVTYHKSFNMNMGMNMMRGFTVDLLAAFLILFLLGQMSNLSIKSSVLACLSIGVLAYLTIPYLNCIWFQTNTTGHLIDAIVPWSLLGLWFGWRLTKA